MEEKTTKTQETKQKSWKNILLILAYFKEVKVLIVCQYRKVNLDFMTVDTLQDKSNEIE